MAKKSTTKGSATKKSPAKTSAAKKSTAKRTEPKKRTAKRPAKRPAAKATGAKRGGAVAKPKTQDITLHTTSADTTYRYEEVSDGVWHMVGVVNADGSIGPVPPPKELPKPDYLPDGRPINPKVLDLSGLRVAPTDLQSWTEKVWSPIKDIPPSPKKG